MSDFNLTHNTFFRNDKAHGRNYELEVGDEKNRKVWHPQLKIKTFDNQANLSVRLIDETVDFKQTSADKGIKFLGAFKNIEFFDIGRDEFEFGVILNKRHDTNVLRFSIRHKNISFHKQLSEAENRKRFGLDCTVDERIAGGYAIYHEGPGLYGRPGYGNGKILNIPRPWAQDANHNRVWCDLDINPITNIMTITLPYEFWATAKYPIFVDPTFGYSNQGASETTIPGQQHIDNVPARHYTASNDQEINYWNAWLRRTAGSCTVDVSAYDMGVGVNDPNGATQVGDIYTFNITETDTATLQTSPEQAVTLTNGINYTISIGNKTEAAGSAKILFDNYGSDSMERSSNESTLSPVFTPGLSNVSYALSFHAVTGNQPGPPVFSGTVPDYNESRVTPFTISFASYFTDPGTFTGTNLPAGSSLNSSTGELTWTAPVTGVYPNISINSENALGNDDTNTFSVTITAQNPVFTGTVTDSSGNVNLEYSLDIRPFFQYADSYSVQSGSLPAGLTLSNGVISGTPTTVETQSAIVIRGTNPDGVDDTNAFEIDVQAALPIPVITSVSNFRRGETATINCTSAGASQGAGFVTVAGNQVTIISWSDSAGVEFTVPADGLRVGSSHDIVLQNDSAYDDTVSEVLLPETGFDYVILDSDFSSLPNDSILADVTEYSAVIAGTRFIFSTSPALEGVASSDNNGVLTIDNAVTGGDYVIPHYLQTTADNLVSPNGSSDITIQTAGSGVDTTAPNWVSSPYLTNIDTVGAVVSGLINEVGNIYAVATSQAQNRPDSEQVKQGLNIVNEAALEAKSILNSNSFSFHFDELAPGQLYYISIVAEDDETPIANIQAAPYFLPFQTNQIVDTTRPTWSIEPAISNPLTDRVTFNAALSESGYVWIVVVDASYQDPSHDQVKDGTWLSGGDTQVEVAFAGYFSGGSVVDYIITGLSDLTNYKLHAVGEDLQGNETASVTTLEFQTLDSGKTRYIVGRLVHPTTRNPIKNTTVLYQIQPVWGGLITDDGEVTTDVNGVFFVQNLNASTGINKIFITDETLGKKGSQALLTVREL